MAKRLALLMCWVGVFLLATPFSFAQSTKQKASAPQRASGAVTIAEILGYEYNNQTNTFSKNVVGVEDSSSIQGSGHQTLVVVKLRRVPGVEYRYVERKLTVTAVYEEKGVTKEVFDTVEQKVPLVDDVFFVPVMIQKGATEMTIKASLYEEGKLISSRSQLLLRWAGD